MIKEKNTMGIKKIPSVIEMEIKANFLDVAIMDNIPTKIASTEDKTGEVKPFLTRKRVNNQSNKEKPVKTIAKGKAVGSMVG